MVLFTPFFHILLFLPFLFRLMIFLLSDAKSKSAQFTAMIYDGDSANFDA